MAEDPNQLPHGSKTPAGEVSGGSKDAARKAAGGESGSSADAGSRAETGSKTETGSHVQGTNMVATRHSLPTTRDSLTHKFMIDQHEGYLTIGLYSDGQPGEIFIKMAKEGSVINGMCQAYCRAFSLALQFGLTIEEAVVRFKGMRFEPMGLTSNPDIPHADSIIDYVARYLELHFGRRGRQ